MNKLFFTQISFPWGPFNNYLDKMRDQDVELFKGGNYSRKYGMSNLGSFVSPCSTVDPK